MKYWFEQNFNQIDRWSLFQLRSTMWSSWVCPIWNIDLRYLEWIWQEVPHFAISKKVIVSLYAAICHGTLMLKSDTGHWCYLWQATWFPLRETQWLFWLSDMVWFYFNLTFAESNCQVILVRIMKKKNFTLFLLCDGNTNTMVFIWRLFPLRIFMGYS